eukprot:gene35921-43569_t
MGIDQLILVCLGLLFSAWLSIEAYEAVGAPQSEVEALESIYNSTHGSTWKWRPTDTYGLIWDFNNATVDPCSGWQGVICGSVAGDSMQHILNVSLPSYNLTGSLPDRIAALVYVDFLDFDYNVIGGVIPLGLCNLTKLEKFSIRNNFLVGKIPPCLQSNLTNLYSLSLHRNLLHGPIPEFGQLNRLRYLSYSTNYLTGTIPVSVTQLPSLAVLFFGYNLLHGPIDLMGNLTSARQLSLSYNLFSTTVPESYAALTQLEIAARSSPQRFAHARMGSFRRLGETPCPQVFQDYPALLTF